jgi:hypothetical protein
VQTLKIANGDIDLDETTGLIQMVDGINKGAQDVARHLLCEFDPFFQQGNEVLTFSIGDPIFTEGLVVQFLTAAVNRLIVKQGTIDAADRVVKITDIRTRRVGLTAVVFYIEVLFGNNETATVVDQIPLAMNQLLDPGPFIKTGN